MKPSHRSACRLLVAVAAGTLVLAGCGSDHATAPRPAAAIQRGDISEGCGMAIAGSPGPRAEAFIGERGQPLKFGSVRDFFAYVLQPENRLRVHSLYVQDAARIDWPRPSDDADTFIDAQRAYYVAWQPLMGMMGPTFASFASRAAAEAFIHAHGGKLLRFNQVTVEVVAGLKNACPTPDSPVYEFAKGCQTGPSA